jgi:hypothetical protein
VPKQPTEQQLMMVQSNSAMQSFNHHRRREWIIYGARHRECPNCGQPPYEPCLNKVDLNKGIPRDKCRVNRQPHDERIDWKRIRDGLRKRGYFRGEWKGTRG